MTDPKHNACISPIAFSRVLTHLYNMSHTTRDGLASYLGVSPQMVSQYLNGKSSPSHVILIKIADYFNVSVDYLLGRTPNPYINTYTNDFLLIVPKTALRVSNMDEEQRFMFERIVSNPEFMNLLDSIIQIKKIVGVESHYQHIHEEDDDNDNLDVSEQMLYNELVKKYPHLEGRLCVASGVDAIEVKRKVLEKQFNSIVEHVTFLKLIKKN